MGRHPRPHTSHMDYVLILILSKFIYAFIVSPFTAYAPLGHIISVFMGYAQELYFTAS